MDVGKVIQKSKVASEYINVLIADASETNDDQALMRGLKQVAQAQGLRQVAETAGIRRESLSRALSERGNPRISTLLSIVSAMGLQLTVKPV